MSGSADQRPICTVDVVQLTLLGNDLRVLVHARPRAPFAGELALPGGYVRPEQDASTWHAAERVLREKVGVKSPYLEQLATWSGKHRDPRGFSISVVYYALVPHAALTDLPKGSLLSRVDALPKLAFDHGEIIAHAVARVRSKSQYSSLPVFLCGDEFTLPELQAVYEAVLGSTLNKVSFRQKLLDLDLLVPVPGKLVGGAHRPAQVYRLSREFVRSLAWVERGL
jgi:8-oxo-dGTP diphosphatase